MFTPKQSSSIRKCEVCRHYGWSGQQKPVQDASNNWHHPACSTVRISIAEARTKFGNLKIKMHDGLPLMVIRPKNPQLAVQIAKIALDKNDGELLDRLPNEVGDYTFIGWAGLTPKGARNAPPMYIVDSAGLIGDELMAGDSFVTKKDVS